MSRGSEYDALSVERATSQTFSPSIAGLLLESNVERESQHAYAAQDYFADEDYDEEAADRAELARRLGEEDASTAHGQPGRAGTTRASSFSHLLAAEPYQAGAGHPPPHEEDDDQLLSRTTKRPRLDFETAQDMPPPARHHSRNLSPTSATSDGGKPTNSRATSNDQRS